MFDHGNSLLNFAGRDDLESDEALAAYADTLVPCVYDDFIGTAKEVLAARHREGLIKLFEFKFKKNARYNLPDKRLRMIERQVQMRARKLMQ